MSALKANPADRDEAGAGPTPPVAPPSRAGRRVLRWALPSFAVITVVFVARLLLGQSAASGPERGAAPRAIPVIGATARVGDLGVYQSGLGTVAPLKTVTVRSRVDGELVSVAYREGQAVRQGELLAQIDSRPFEVQLHQAEGQLAKDQAALRNANVDLERYRVLIGEDSIPRQQLDTQAATVDQLEAAVKSDQAQVESAKLNLTYSRITAPIAGVVGLRLVDPGNIVHAGDSTGLVVITQQQPIAVVFTIPGDQLPVVQRQMRAGRKLTVEVWDRDLKSKLATGTLLAIDNQIDQTTGTVRLKALFPNADLALYPNQFVNARLLVDTLQRAILVPAAAIQHSPKSSYVYVVKPDDTVELRDVDVRLTEGDDTAVSRGLAAGEVVVVDGVDKLQPGAKVALGGDPVPRAKGSG